MKIMPRRKNSVETNFNINTHDTINTINFYIEQTLIKHCRCNQRVDKI